MSDLVVSYTKADREWAEWVSWILEEAGFSVTVQAWDFGGGGNFILEMQRATAEESRTVAILSPDYFQSRYAAPEWAAALASDPDGLNRRLIPVRVRECRPEGLWAGINYIDLVGADEVTAQERLLAGVRGTRGKPQERPRFPGPAMAQRGHPRFPGLTRVSTMYATPYVPRLAAANTDLNKRKFLRECFGTIATYFKSGLAAMAERLTGVEYEFDDAGSAQFKVEIFFQDQSRCRCKIWIADEMGGGIAYFEGRDWGGRNALNDILVVSEHAGNLILTAQMGFAFRRVEGLDLERLSPAHAAEYLWRQLVSHLEP